MYKLPYQHVYMIGIGGAGMSALARILLEQGVRVTGSDATVNDALNSLACLGANIWLGQAAEHVPVDADLVAYSAAIRPDHPEREAATERGLRQCKYAELVGELTRARQTLAISGTHGKTTTTCMLASIMDASGQGPAWLVGGTPRSLPAASRWDNGAHFVLEACEYDRSFLNYSPRAALIHNIEPDHMDYFGTMDALTRAFRDFAGGVVRGGVVFANADCPGTKQALRGWRRKIIRYGMAENAAYRAVDLSEERGCQRFTVLRHGQPLCDVRLAVPGRIQIMNALAAAAVADWAGVNSDTVARSLAAYRGVRRRFDLLGTPGGVPVIDDYAHHPTALRELVAAARACYPDRKLTFVFQAHQYGRLLGFHEDFLDALSGRGPQALAARADEVLICRTYAARESNVTPGEPEERFARDLRSRGIPAVSMASFDSVLAHLRSTWTDDRAIFTVGAGDVDAVARMLLADFSAPPRAAVAA